MLNAASLTQAVAGAGTRVAVLDMNLLVLWISKRVGVESLKSFKRVKAFTIRDALLLEWLLSQFAGLATTAYVLAETSNLANELSGHLRDRWYRELGAFAAATPEQHVQTTVVGAQPELLRFGIADAALSYLSNRHTIITSEYKLSGYLEAKGRNVINFNHLRPVWMANG